MAQYNWVFRAILALVGGIFLWFWIGAVFGTDAATTKEATKQLLGIAAFGFSMAALLPWPPAGA